MALAERPTPDITDRDDGGGKVRMVPHARARVAPARRAPKAWPLVGRIAAGKFGTHGDGIWEKTPDSLADVVRYTRAGGWVPGDWPWWVELPGKLYGWFIAVPVTLAAHLALWAIQRPTRLAGITLLSLLLWWAS